MGKPNWKDAPPAIQRALEDHRRDTRLPAAGGQMLTVRALGTLNWLRAAYARGFDVPPSEVPTPAHDQLAAFTGEAVDLARLRVTLSLELDFERRAKLLSESMRAWAAAPSEAEKAARATADRETAARERELDARANQILAEAETSRLDKAKQVARQRAEKEMTK